jgi:hypothetical protein
LDHLDVAGFAMVGNHHPNLEGQNAVVGLALQVDLDLQWDIV